MNINDTLSRASTQLHRCNPQSYIENVTFHQFTNTFQAYIVNKADLHWYCQRMSCKEYKDFTSVDGCYSGLNDCSGNNKCARVYNCGGYIDSPADVCVSKSSNRRYDFIYGKYFKFGKKPSNPLCKERASLEYSTGFWALCDYCLCMCDDDKSNADRYFYMKPYSGDKTKNEVITGLRFVKVKQIIHLQIQVGILLKRAKVLRKLRWVPIDDVKIDDVKYDGGDNYYVFRQNNSFLNLDLIMADNDNMVVTGELN